MRPHSAAVITGDWSGTATGEGSETLTTTQLLENNQNPKVRWLNDEQRALAAGITDATIEVGPLTPDHNIGGVAIATLAGTGLSTTDTLHLWIVGPKHPSGARYRVVEIRADSSLHYMLRAKPVA